MTRVNDQNVYLTQTSASDTYFHMLPGPTYMIWIWAWTGAVSLSQGAYGFGVIDATVPFIVLAQE